MSRAKLSIRPYLTTTSHFAEEGYEAGEEPLQAIRDARILVLGAGGLGCEILKNLACSGFTDIHVIDMDTIDVSNLNRQFLFRPADVGRPKAVVAAEYVMKRFTQVTITPYFGKLQDKDEAYYKQFSLIISGLDSIEARRWINSTLVNMADPDDFESIKPLIDGGTEGFKGQCKMIIPTFTACYECSLDTISGQTTYPMCTISNNPRLPEHCIEYASEVLWKKYRDDEKLDMDIPEHVTWLTEKSIERAKEFNIDGVTRSLVLGVVKNIIPAIASTNAIVAAACCNEAFKYITSSVPNLNNFMMYSGSDSVFTYCFKYERKPDCLVCGGR